MILFLITIGGLILLCLIVFGGGQIFMPLFRSFWEILAKNGASITSQQIDTIFTIANSTPGVTSTKFAAMTGYLIANGAWWGWIAFIGTYVIFALPSIFLVVIGYKALQKSKDHKYLSKIVLYMKPVIAGSIFALAIQLFIGAAFPQIIFNKTGDYLGLNKSDNFISGWRMYVTIFYVSLASIEVAFFTTKYKINTFYLILVHLVIGILILAPWV